VLAAKGVTFATRSPPAAAGTSVYLELTEVEVAGNTPLYAIHGNTPLVVATLTGEGRWSLPGVNNTNS
jgi:hypothetical protein